MILFLGALFLIIAFATRAGHEVFRHASRIQLRHLADQEVRGSRAAQGYLDDEDLFRAALSAWETAFVLMGSTLVAGGAFASHGIPLLLPTVLVSALVYATLGALSAGLATLTEERVVRAMASIIAPLVALSHRGAARGAEEFRNGAQTAEAEEEADRESFEELIEEGVREGIGDTEDMKLVSGVVELRDLLVSDVMIARDAVFALPVDLPLDEIASRISASGYSRVPIYSGTLDTVIGIYHVLDVLKAVPRDMPPLRSVATSAPTDRCIDLLHRMLRQQVHICIVSDSAGRTVGLVTLEDLLEEIVGEISDEFDEPAQGSTGPRR